MSRRFFPYHHRLLQAIHATVPSSSSRMTCAQEPGDRQAHNPRPITFSVPHGRTFNVGAMIDVLCVEFDRRPEFRVRHTLKMLHGGSFTSSCERCLIIRLVREVPSASFLNHTRSQALIVLPNRESACGMPLCNGCAGRSNPLEPRDEEEKPYPTASDTPKEAVDCLCGLKARKVPART